MWVILVYVYYMNICFIYECLDEVYMICYIIDIIFWFLYFKVIYMRIICGKIINVCKVYKYVIDYKMLVLF